MTNSKHVLSLGTLFLLTLLTAVFFAFSAVASDDAAGSLRNKDGDVLIERNGIILKAEEGMQVYPADTIRTGANGSVGVILKDNSRISIGPESRFELKDYVFEPNRARFSFVSRLLKGIASFVSGKMTKLSPESVILETPTAMIGVRGTSYHVKVREE